jgi:dTDP-glucose 4,6-dehydratase
VSKHLLLTGGAGFLGHHFVNHILLNTDWTITIIDRLTYAGSQNHLTDIAPWEKEGRRVNFVFHDFRAQFLGINLAMVSDPHPDYIVHMGAETHVDNSIRDPRPFVESNMMGTLNMLELCKALQPEKFIYISTDEVYGPAPFERVDPRLGRASELHLHKEGEPHRPSNPYSASKSGAEALCYAFWNTYSLPIMITNTMNLFGERQSPEKFIPRTVRSIIRGEPVTIHVKKSAAGEVVDVSSRCWLHARNQSDGVMFLLNNIERYGESFNIVGDWADCSMMADKIAHILGKEIVKDYQDFHSFRPGHDMHYGLDGAKMAALGWDAPQTLTESLEHTIRWMQANPAWLQLDG